MFVPGRLVFVIGFTLTCAGLASASSSIYTPVERVAEISPLIVEGRVVRTGSGFDPVTGALSTYVSVDVSFVHRGPAGLSHIVVREPGGRFGDLVHVMDGVPAFTPGEDVLLFLEPANDRSLRVAGMFFGKLALADAAKGSGRVARRDLPGAVEEFPESEIASVIVSGRYEAGTWAAAPEWVSVPPEFDRLDWDGVRDADQPVLDFMPLSSSSPARWHQADVPTAVTINMQPSGNPMNDPTAAWNAVTRGMAAWTNVPEARVVLQPGDPDYAFTASNAQSPTAANPPVNVILFNDPYGDISDPSGCSGTLAVGGYWRSGSNSKVVNGVTFYPVLHQYVVFNNNFQCFLGNADNLAEVTAHELGHGIGFGHSAVSDAIMRSSAYGNGRGPRLGNDDRDGAHCHYPHTLSLTSPNGGESWAAGSTHTIAWTATVEAGPDPGTVDVEYSGNAGSTWSVISAGQPNDGAYSWTIAAAPGAQSLVRVVRHNRVASTPSPYPEACSQDASNAVFTVTSSAPAVAGTSPDGSNGVPLRVTKGVADALILTWGASCSAAAGDYAVYEGSLVSLSSGVWNHVPKTCSAGTDLVETITPDAASSYYLVAPLTAAQEGLLGDSSSGPRPASASACAPRESSSCP